MRLSPVSQLLLVLLSVLALTRAQTTTQTSADTTTTTTTVPATTQTSADTTTTTTTTVPATTQTSADTTTTTTTAEPATTQTIGTTAEPTTTPLTTTPTTTAWTAPAIFYPFGLAAGDGEQFEIGYESFVNFTFSTPFTFFGRTYNYIYVNNNGLLTFNQPITEAEPYIIPSHGGEDFIAPLWTDLDDIGLGKYWYQQYTNGSVLTRATQDINQYFPQMNFTASSVFVATWDYVNTGDINAFIRRSEPTITFQAVLVSGGVFSFILMNYGDCVSYYPLEAGFDTIGSTNYHVIHYENAGYTILNLKNTTNVDVPGRWAFLVNDGTENVLGVQIKLSSFLDLTQTGNIEDVLKQIKQELVNRGASSFFQMNLRNVKKTQP